MRCASSPTTRASRSRPSPPLTVVKPAARRACEDCLVNLAGPAWSTAFHACGAYASRAGSSPPRRIAVRGYVRRVEEFEIALERGCCRTARSSPLALAEFRRVLRGRLVVDRADSRSRRSRRRVPNYPTFTSTLLGFAFSDFGRCTFRTPSLNSACTFVASASSGNENERAKLP